MKLTDEQLRHLARAYKEIDELVDILEEEKPDRTDCGSIHKTWVLLHDTLVEQVGEDFNEDELAL